jgi:cell division protein FtsN
MGFLRSLFGMAQPSATESSNLLPPAPPEPGMVRHENRDEITVVVNRDTPMESLKAQRQMLVLKKREIAAEKRAEVESQRNRRAQSTYARKRTGLVGAWNQVQRGASNGRVQSLDQQRDMLDHAINVIDMEISRRRMSA